MLRFINGNEAQWKWLREQIQGVLYTFDQTQLPDTCTPSVTRIGFEYTPQNGYVFYINKGISYSGTDREFKNLLESGEKKFEEYHDMENFVKGLKSIFNEKHSEKQTDSAKPEIQNKNSRDPTTLYDRSQIKELEQEQQQIFIDSDKIYTELISRIKGQDLSMKTLSEVTQIHLAQVEPQMPATVFIAGPTGTGKTESANALLHAINKYSSKKYQMLRINCNQYKESHRVAQLLGSPNGYIGYGDPPVIAPLANNSRTIVLWDEIEKAHSDILDVIMGALDTGIIQLPSPIKGSNEIDCKQSIFIFTSNLPIYQCENKKIGFNNDSQSTEVQNIDEMCKKALVEKGFKPEIAGRISSYLLFNTLDSSVIADIIAIAIVNCAKSFGLSVKHIDTPIISDLLSTNSASFGARTYKQDIQRKLGKAFASASQKHKGRDISIKGTLLSPVIE